MLSQGLLILYHFLRICVSRLFYAHACTVWCVVCILFATGYFVRYWNYIMTFIVIINVRFCIMVAKITFHRVHLLIDILLYGVKTCWAETGTDSVGRSVYCNTPISARALGPYLQRITHDAHTNNNNFNNIHPTLRSPVDRFVFFPSSLRMHQMIV